MDRWPKTSLMLTKTADCKHRMFFGKMASYSGYMSLELVKESVFESARVYVQNPAVSHGMEQRHSR